VLAPPRVRPGKRTTLSWLLLLPQAYIRGWRRVRPTTEGWIFLASGFAVLLAAVNTGNNLLYLVLATMLSMVALSGILSELALRGLRVRRRIDEPAFARRASHGRWCMSRSSGWSPGLALRLEELVGPHLELDERAVANVLCLRQGQRQDVPACWVFSRRGRHRLKGVRVSTTWPFGIFVKSSNFPLHQEVVVFPEPRDHAVVRTAGSTVGSLEELRPQRGGDGDFLGLREYQRGEDPRRVHWRTSARLGRLVAVERARSPRAGRIEVWIKHPGRGELMERRLSFEDQLSRATYALTEGVAGGSEVRLHLPDGGLCIARDPAGLYRSLGVLATAILDEEAA